MRILSTNEQETFNRPPLFDHQQRKQFLSFSKNLRNIAMRMRTSSNKIGFLVMCGYFKATKRFYLPQDFYERDVEAVARQLGLDKRAFKSHAYIETTRLRHQKQILEFCGFKPFDKNVEDALAFDIATMARMHLKPRLIFDRCLDFLIQQRTQIPSLRILTDMVRAVLHDRKAELVALMDAYLRDDTRALLDDLFATADDQNRYRLTLLKKLSQSTKPTRIKESITDFQTLAELYGNLENILSLLHLGPAGIRYFAGSVLKSEVFQIHRRHENDRYIHTVAFVAHQFYRIQDHLTDTFLNVLSSFQTTISREHKDRLAAQRIDQQNALKTAVDDLDKSVFGLIYQIRELADNVTLSDTQKIIEIKSALSQRKASAFEKLKADLIESGQDQSWFDVLETHSLKLQNRLNPILKALTFGPNDRSKRLLIAVDHFKANDGSIGDRPPVDFLDSNERTVLKRADGMFRPSLYKVFLFQKVGDAIKSGDLNLEQSYKYRPMDAYLIDRDRWDHNREQLLERAGLREFTNPDPVLKKLDEVLTTQYRTTNEHAPKNPHLKFRPNGTFHIATPPSDASEVAPLSEWFPQRHDVPLAQVLETINNHSGMLNAFEHWQQTHSRQAASRPALLAGIMGLGCGIGVRKMARISSRITESELEHAVNWRFSLDNIRAANDAVVEAMDLMELPNLYRRNNDVLHTASDGQKFEVRGESLHASRSFKYFGQGQGVSAYTFVDERNFLWHSLMISASDRESAYVIDGLMHNDVVKSDIHSTDTHGYTETVFGLTHLLGFSFAPRIKSIGKQTIYIFKPKNKADKDWKIQPDKTINDTLIRENWDELLRLVTTIKLKENTASDIFRRLNSYSRQHALYQALKAFGQIIKSLFVLRYIDDLELRQAIEKQLNKVELANRFTRAVAVGNPREFTQAEKEEQEIAEACNRLIKNSIICWNYLYLTSQLEKANAEDEKENLRQIIRRHSPMTWAHINMLGEYDFSDEKLKDSVGILPLKSAV
jgi:TnpA family transposase